MSLSTRFTNQEMTPEILPDAFRVNYRKLAPAYRTYSMIRATLGFGFFFVMALVFLLMTGELNSMIRVVWFFLGMALLYALRMFIKYYGYGKKGYALRQHDALYRSGIWWKRNVFIPKNRIQHVEIKKSPLEDVFGICRLMIFTAGGSGSDLVIPGLEPDLAERLKENLMSQIAHDQEE